jgi:predicted acetyltransferase
MKIRRIAPEERYTTAFPLRAYAFAPSPRSLEDLEKTRRYEPYHKDNVTLVVEDDSGQAVATASSIPMRQNVRGTVYPMAGIAGVATSPLARRHGYIRQVLTQLLGDVRDDGFPVSALYPFRPSFYGRFGYAGLAKERTLSVPPADLGGLLRLDVPGEVLWARAKDGFDGYREVTHRLLPERHGFAVFPDYRAAELRDEDERWIATAWVGGEPVGALAYRITDHAGELIGEQLLHTGVAGHTLLLQFLARHVDQVARVIVDLMPDEHPELWLTDLAMTLSADIGFPDSAAPMARVLSVDALAGLAVGPAHAAVRVVDDPFIAGDYVLDGTAGKLEVTRGGSGSVTLTAAGLSALVFGVISPEELPLRGWGDGDPALGTLFPRRIPSLVTHF